MSFDVRDEVSFSDYRTACLAIAAEATALAAAPPDEAAEHYLPEITRNLALVFSFVGSNMTARHVPRYLRTVAELELAKGQATRTRERLVERVGQMIYEGILVDARATADDARALAVLVIERVTQAVAAGTLPPEPTH